MKKIFAIALVLCLLVAIVACGGDEDNTEIADTTVSTTAAGGETTTEPEGETTTEAGGLPVEENNDTSFGEAIEGKKS